MSETRKILQLVYSATEGETIDGFMDFLLSKFESNNVKEVIGFHNHRKITIEEIEE